MTQTPASARQLIPARTSTRCVLVGAIFVLVFFTALKLGAPQLLGLTDAVIDYNVFRLAGGLALEGRLAEAYDAASFFRIQAEDPSAIARMPWTYPPHYNLFVTALTPFPVWTGYLIFVTGTLALWVLALARLDRENTVAVLVLTLPAAIVCIRAGQNGFLTGALIGLFAIWHLSRSPKAGIPLGLMAMKPHLALGVAAMTLLGRDWRVVGIAASLTLAAIVAPTIAFGPEVWSHFRLAVDQAATFMEAGIYPLSRMTSIYAFARSLGLSADLSMYLHIAGALLALALIVQVTLTRWQPRRMLAVAIMGGLMFSPYNYDYDLTIAAVGLILAAPDLAALAGRVRRLVLFVACYVATGWGMVLAALNGGSAPDALSLGALGYVTLFLLTWRTLARAEATAEEPSATDALTA